MTGGWGGKCGTQQNAKACGNPVGQEAEHGVPQGMEKVLGGLGQVSWGDAAV